MRFLDLSTFYAERAGGIRTYHRAKLAYFLQHPEHDYTLVAPGPAFGVKELAENVRLVEVFGPRLSREEGGYRLLLGAAGVRRALRTYRPDVVEVGDPWVSGPLALLLRRFGAFGGLLAAFHHGDPVHAWLEPWAARGGRLRARTAEALGRAFYGLQRRYDVTLVASRFVEERLRSRGVGRLARCPFGTDPLFFEGARPARREGPVRLLYAGRLGAEKGARLLLEILPAIVEIPNVEVTVLGRGALAEAFAAFEHPRYRFGGHVAERAALAEAYLGHDVLLAPGPHETFGLGILEAMASGLVVVGPESAGAGELLRKAASPFSFAAGEAASFLGAVRRAAASDLGPHARRAREAALRFGTWEEAVGRMVQTYANLVTERKAHERLPARLALAP